MIHYFLTFFLLLLPLQKNSFSSVNLPEGFVFVQQMIPDIACDIRYAGHHNFTGRPVAGYEAATPILSAPAAKALKKVQRELRKKNLALKIFDAYRPQRAVDNFMKWARIAGDTLTKSEFYPEVPKSELFARGYIATKSGHSRGSTVDLTLIDLETGKELDMGGPYDFFGEISHHNTSHISQQQKENRNLLKKAMSKYGFRPYSEEWWHYTLRKEPYPNTYFNFVVK
ncbi:MAG: M15 family metallopeptidase [Salegentibacter sp.]